MPPQNREITILVPIVALVVVVVVVIWRSAGIIYYISTHSAYINMIKSPASNCVTYPFSKIDSLELQL